MTETALAWLEKLGPYLGIAVLALIAWTQHSTISAQDTAITTLKEHASAVAAQLKKNADNQAKADQHSQDLQAAQDQLRLTLSQRAIDIRNLQNDLEDLHAWASQPLPDSIVRLRQRPAITGSAAYQEYLSSHQPLHVVGQQPPDGGRPEPAAGTGGD